jgi:hypothetical protein
LKNPPVPHPESSSGLPGFYTTFCRTLYEEFDKEMPIWVIGHAGHDEPGKEKKMTTPPLKGNEGLYDLKGQLDHKIEFYNRFVPKDVKIYLIGHSIGSKFCMELMKIPEFSKQVEHCYLMFPAIERMAESNKGKLVPTYDRYFFLFRIFYNVLHVLPKSWKRSLVAWFCRRDKMPEEFLDPSVEYTNPPVIDKIWFLALDEMEKIREIDEEAIKSNMHRLKLYYGTKDDWVRTEYYHELVAKFPGIDAELCKKQYEHAFVLKSGVEVGKMVAEWINLKRQVKVE